MPLAAASTVSSTAVERLPQQARDVVVVPKTEVLLSASMRRARQPVWPLALMPPLVLVGRPARRREALTLPPVLGRKPAWRQASTLPPVLGQQPAWRQALTPPPVLSQQLAL